MKAIQMKTLMANLLLGLITLLQANLSAATFTDGAITPNEITVAKRLNSITDSSLFLSGILTELLTLPQDEYRTALSQMSGEQHTSGILLTQNLSHQFIRRMYDPLRTLTQQDPYKWNPCCEDWSFWGEVSGGGAHLKGNCNARGLNGNRYEITIGAQKTLCNTLTLGMASSYANNRVRYNIGGSEDINSYMGGLYALFRPACFYILADLAYVYNKGNLHRPIQVGNNFLEAHSKPQVTDCTFYTEFGMDFFRWNLGIQPYFGVEVDTIWRKTVTENHAHDFNLRVDKLNKTYTLGSLGVHITQKSCDYTVSLDLAWTYRFTSVEQTIPNNFETFGTLFYIDGVPIDKNNVEGTLYFSKKICDCWHIYAELTSQVWSRFATYDALIGIQSGW